MNKVRSWRPRLTVCQQLALAVRPLKPCPCRPRIPGNRPYVDPTSFCPWRRPRGWCAVGRARERARSIRARRTAALYIRVCERAGDFRTNQPDPVSRGHCDCGPPHGTAMLSVPAACRACSSQLCSRTPPWPRPTH